MEERGVADDSGRHRVGAWNEAHRRRGRNERIVQYARLGSRHG